VADSYPDVSVIERDSPQGKRENANAINNLLGRVDAIETLIEILRRIDLEATIMALTTDAAFLDGETIAPYQLAAAIDPEALITQNLTAGTITAGVDGWYSASAYVAGTGSNNSAFYGAILEVNPGGIQYILGINQWTNTNPGMGFNGSANLLLTAGDALSVVAFASAGTLNVIDASLSLKLESLT
jgi:hypothetical protein